jgi:hypothetical protein
MTHLVTQDLVDRYMGGETVDLVALHRAAGGSDVFREAIARIDTPILLLQGDGESVENSFNAEFLIPDLEAAGKDLSVASFAGPHCFAFGGTSPAALEAFGAADAYIKEHVEVQPVPLDPALVSRAPAGQPPEREAIEVSSAVLAEYVGRYRLPKGLAGFPPDVAPTMVVTLDGSRLHVEVLEGTLGKVPFTAQSETFFFSPQGWIMEFVEDDTGTVTGLFWERGFLAPRL